MRRMYDRFLRARERSFEPEPEAPTAAAREAPVPVRIASAEERASGATCRICFSADFDPARGPSTGSGLPVSVTPRTAPGLSGVSTPGESELVAPCRCLGTQEWVHVGCLQRWQRSVSSSSLSPRLQLGILRAMLETGQPPDFDSRQATAGSARAQSCNVCLAPFALPPPPIPTGELDFGPGDRWCSRLHRYHMRFWQVHCSSQRPAGFLHKAASTTRWCCC